MKKYTIEDLLVDTQYKNSLGQIGVITSAKERKNVYIPGEAKAYLVEYYIPKYGSQKATVMVEIEN